MSKRSMNPTQRNCGTCAYWCGQREVKSSIIYMDSSERAKCLKTNSQKTCGEGCGNYKQVGK